MDCEECLNNTNNTRPCIVACEERKAKENKIRREIHNNANNN